MLELLIKLILAHLIGDFLIQPKKWVVSKEEKKIKSKYLYYHILVHLGALLLVLQFNMDYLLGIVLIIIFHLAIDLTKLYSNEKLPNHKRELFFIDQLLHVGVILFIVKYYFPATQFLDNLYSSQIVLLLLFMVFVTFTCNIILMVILSKWDMKNIDQNAKEMLEVAEIKQEQNNKETKGSLENAGKYIGMLERLFIFFLVIFNQPLGVGLLITAKSVFRYNDLTKAKDRKLTEYILIGSMLSFGLAIISGITFKYILKYL